MDSLSLVVLQSQHNSNLILSYCCAKQPRVQVVINSESELLTELTRLKANYGYYIWLAENLSKLLEIGYKTGFSFTGINIIDLSIEANMLVQTHPEFFGNALPSCITKTPTLLDKVINAHIQSKSQQAKQVLITQMITRANYIKAIIKLTVNGKGFPIDEQILKAIFTNKAQTVSVIQEEANLQYGTIFLKNIENSTKLLDHDRLKQLAKNKGYQWKSSISGHYLKMDKGYLKQLANQYPELRFFYDAITTISSIQSLDLLALETDGFIKPSLYLMTQKTGRNSPKPSEGYLLNASHWIRSLIRPKPNHCIIAIDWCQQEIGIAAALSNDKNLIDIYNAPECDVYLALAKMAGFSPKSATKKTHPEIRQLFKTMQIGLGYGKSVWSLTKDIKQLSKSITLSDAYNKAQQIHRWHKTTFTDYWQWTEDTINQARRSGFIQSLDGWTYFVTDSVRDTQLLNFPMQANGAALMRLAIVNLAKYENIDLICTQHDAIYVNAKNCDKERIIKQIQDSMDKACADLFNGKITLRTDLTVYDECIGFNQNKATTPFERIINQLKEVA